MRWFHLIETFGVGRIQDPAVAVPAGGHGLRAKRAAEDDSQPTGVN